MRLFKSGNGLMSILRYNRRSAREALLRGERVPWIEQHRRRDYIRRCVLSFPPWVDRKALHALWRLARQREWQTGEPHVLDHIVPVSHPLVCGLSVPWNFQVIPASVNAKKGCEWAPDDYKTYQQGELFS
jgi:hypothetical protein